jgi:AcrR family transcriptional regulator
MNSLNIFSISPSKDPVVPSEASSSAKSPAPKKLDHRVLMTRRLFRQALTELLRQKPLQSITVKELCQKAGVNRGTFYSHYTDIFALMEQIEGEVSRELSDTLEDFTSRNPQSSPFSVYTSILQFFRKNSDICTVLLSGYGDRSFLEKLFQTGRESCTSVYGEMFPSASQEQLEMFYTFVSSGCVGLLRYWIDTGMALPEESLAKCLEYMVTGSLQYLQASQS